MALPPEAQLADRSARLWAATIDELILLGISLPAITGAVMTAAPSVSRFMNGDPTAGMDEWDAMSLGLSLFSGPGFLLSLVLLLAWTVITLWFVAANSQSIGKRMVGIKVVRSDGSPASLARIILLRNLVNMLPALVLPTLGMLYELIDPLFIYQQSHQCLHDKLADTVVIRCSSTKADKSIAG